MTSHNWSPEQHKAYAKYMKEHTEIPLAKDCGYVLSREFAAAVHADTLPFWKKIIQTLALELTYGHWPTKEETAEQAKKESLRRSKEEDLSNLSRTGPR